MRSSINSDGVSTLGNLVANDTPELYVALISAFPSLPSFVVIIITPLDPLAP